MQGLGRYVVFASLSGALLMVMLVVSSRQAAPKSSNLVLGEKSEVVSLYKDDSMVVECKYGQELAILRVDEVTVTAVCR